MAGEGGIRTPPPRSKAPVYLKGQEGEQLRFKGKRDTCGHGRKAVGASVCVVVSLSQVKSAVLP